MIWPKTLLTACGCSLALWAPAMADPPEPSPLATLSGAQGLCVMELMKLVATTSGGRLRESTLTGRVEAYADGADTIVRFAPGQPKYDPIPVKPGVIPLPPPPPVMGGVVIIRCGADGVVTRQIFEK